MKPILTSFKFISAIALLAVAVGCASTKQTENLLTLAGFKPIVAGTPKQQQQIKALPSGKISRIQRSGKTYYVFPDKTHNWVYVGSPKQYRDYQQIRADYQLSNESLADAKVDQDAPSDYDDWGGWEVVVWSD